MSGCLLCPRRCAAARTTADPGRCGADQPPGWFRVASLMRHFWEEPFISGPILADGRGGSGAVFFSGCALGCCFCQNRTISQQPAGRLLSMEELAVAIMSLYEQGAVNINLVTPSHYADRLPALIARLREDPRWQTRPLPVVWNSSGYETAASLEAMADFVDIWLPDLKFASTDLSQALAEAPDYFEVASQAILTMNRLAPQIEWGPDGLLRRGLVIRHLILPGHWRDSCLLLDFLAGELPSDIPLSLMRQYTPQPGGWPPGHPELARRLTTWEYRQVLDHALDLGFTKVLGQERAAADCAYTPDFSSFWLDSDGKSRPDG